MKYRIKEKVLSLHGAYQIFDENDNECFHVKQNAVSLTNKTVSYTHLGLIDTRRWVLLAMRERAAIVSP